jgi:hypothetical protein
VKGPPSKVMRLPEELRTAVDRHLIDQSFRNYKAIANWIQRQSHEISLSSLKRYGLRLQQELQKTQLVVLQARIISEALPGGADAIAEDLIQLARQKLSLALAEANLAKVGDVARLVHAVAHLTQTALALQRGVCAPVLEAAQGEESDPLTKSNPRGGLSPETSQALRNALLGIGPLSPDEIGWLKADAEKIESDASSVATQFEKREQTNPTEPAAPLPRGGRFGCRPN